MTTTSILRLPPRKVDLCRPGADDREIQHWVRLARQGDLDAWSKLYRRCIEGVYRHICYLLGDPVAAEDLAQEVFARAMSSITTFADQARFTTWLHGIAVNVVRMHWRRADATRRAFNHLAHLRRGEAQDAAEGPAGAHLKNQKMEVLYGVLATLPEHLREAFVLRDMEGLSVGEVAAQLGITGANVAVRAHRARLRIRDELERLGWLTEASVP